MNATINGIDYTDPKEAKAAIRLAQAQARKEEKARSAKFDAAVINADVTLTRCAQMIQRHLDGRRINWSVTKPQTSHSFSNGCHKATYWQAGHHGDFDHWPAAPSILLTGPTGDMAVKAGDFWFAVGVFDGMVVLQEIPAFMAEHLDAFAAEKGGA